MKHRKISLMIIILIFSLSFAGAWWNSSWEYRKPISVTEESGNDISSYPVELSINTSSLIDQRKLESDCSDLRFVDSADSQRIDHWIQSGCNTENTVVWVEIPSLASSSNNDFYMYYSNSGSGDVSDPNSVWQKYVNFSQENINSGYGGQDSDPSSYEVLDNGRTLHMWDNTWKRTDYSFTSDSQTVLMYSFKSENNEPEINGIGFESNDQIDSNGWDAGERHWIIYGYQDWGKFIDDYSGSGWEKRSFRPIDYGVEGESYSYLFYDNDNDDNVNTDAYYKDVRIGQKVSPSPSKSFGQEEIVNICDSRGANNECIVSDKKDISGESYQVNSVLEFWDSSLLKTEGSDADISVSNRSVISGIFQGDINLSSEKTVLKPGASFRPDRRIILGLE